MAQGNAGGRLTVRPMTEDDARAVATWRYDLPYDFYNPESTDEAAVIAELLDGSHYAVTEAGDLVGFLAYGPDAQIPGGHTHGAYTDEALDIGLGLRPDLTGRGLGLAFVQTGIDFARERYGPPLLRLAVATFNRRAIIVYERAGFRPGPTVPSPVHGRDVDFLIMTLLLA